VPESGALFNDAEPVVVQNSIPAVEPTKCPGSAPTIMAVIGTPEVHHVARATELSTSAHNTDGQPVDRRLQEAGDEMRIDLGRDVGVLFLRRADLLLENLALRQQLAVLVHSGRRPRIDGADRVFWMILSRGGGRRGPIRWLSGSPRPWSSGIERAFVSIGLGSRDVLGKGDRPSVVT
jgi:hypothetical protein